MELFINRILDLSHHNDYQKYDSSFSSTHLLVHCGRAEQQGKALCENWLKTLSNWKCATGKATAILKKLGKYTYTGYPSHSSSYSHTFLYIKHTHHILVVVFNIKKTRFEHSKSHLTTTLKRGEDAQEHTSDTMNIIYVCGPLALQLSY